ncbi:MAG: hypothetical protein M0T78_12415 [Actinomycetota bacterium]|jgi:hypothetical protein|nr:hypothetical protein [Actinomycetota bacterium]
MAIVALLESTELRVEPGKTAETTITVYNTTDIVEQFHVQPLGQCADWTVVEPDAVSLFPGTSGSMKVKITPPRRFDTPPGIAHFGLLVSATNFPNEDTVEEGTIDVLPFEEIKAELAPQSVTGRIRSKMSLAVDSLGNSPVTVHVVTKDPTDSLAFLVRPRSMELTPGKAHFTKIRIRPRKKMFRGTSKVHRFKVSVQREGSEPVTIDGTMSQRPVLTRLGIGALVLLTGLLAWYAVIKPAVKNVAVSALAPSIAAQNQASQVLTQKVSTVNSQLSQAASQVSTVSSQVNALSSSTTAASTTTTSTTTTSTTTTTVPTTTTTTLPPKFQNVNYNTTLETISPPGSTGSTSFNLSSSQTFSLTDLVVEDLSGGSGIVRVQQYVASSKTTRDLFLYNLVTLVQTNYRFNTPAVFNPGDKFLLTVTCGTAQSACDVAAYMAGNMNQPIPATTTTPAAG